MPSWNPSLLVPMMRAIDKGLANSRIGLVLVTPALLSRLLKVLLIKNFRRYWLVTSSFLSCITRRMEALRNVSPWLLPEVALIRERIRWQLLQQKLQS